MPVIRKPELPHIIIGTAGHVDHGKTSLIKFLTGCETDKLREEKERGLSINLGFAPCMFPGNRVVGVVDVPGHIDFIRNMVAGAASIDILLLVIAADDGVMPQTVEHMQIVNLLRTPRVLVALTKTDLVDAETLELAKEDVRGFLVETGFPDAPIMPVSNVTFEGIPEVLEKLDEFISEVDTHADDRLFRMHVERTFSVKGMGTVATGIPTAGHVSTDETLEVHPLGKTSSIRTIHNYKHKTDQTAASICSAINLRDLDADDLERGMTLGTPEAFTATNSVLVTLKNVTTEFPLKHNSEVKFHSGTAETLAKVGLIENNLLTPGSATVARIILDNPLVLVPGDTYVIRKLSPSVTYGGGCVLADGGYRFKRSSAPFRARIRAAAKAADAGDYFAATVLAGASPLLSQSELLRLTYMRKEAADAMVESKLEDGLLVQLDKGFFLVESRVEEMVPAVLERLSAYHKDNPYSLGMLLEQLADALDLPSACIRRLTAQIRTVDASVQYQNNRLSLTSFVPKISAKLIDQKERLETIIADAENQGVARGNVKSDLCITEADMKTLCKILIEEDALVIIGNRLLSAEAFDTCKRVAIDLFEAHGVIELPPFRDQTGMARNMAITVLEKLDSIGLTRRTDTGRMLVKAKKNEVTA